MSQQRKKAGGDQNVVYQRNNGDNAVLPRSDRLRYFAKRKCNKKDDAHRHKPKSDEPFVEQLLPDSWRDGCKLIFVDGPERAERLLERIFFVIGERAFGERIAVVPVGWTRTSPRLSEAATGATCTLHLCDRRHARRFDMTPAKASRQSNRMPGLSPHKSSMTTARSEITPVPRAIVFRAS